MNNKNLLPQGDEKAGHSDEFQGLLWGMPEDVRNEWKMLSPQEQESLVLALKPLLEEIANTLAVVAINTRLLPVAANRLKEHLKSFRFSLQDMPFPPDHPSATKH